MAGSPVLHNPFSQNNARSTGPQFNDPGKHAPQNQPRQADQTFNNNDNNNSADGSLITGFDDDNNQNPGLDSNDNNNNNDEYEFDQKTGKKIKKARDPMLDFDNLWEPNEIDPDNPPEEFAGYLPNIDPKVFGERVNQMDFARNIKPELLQAIAAGGDGALKALPEVINMMGRQFFTQTFNASKNMTAAGLTSVEKRFMNDLIPTSIRDSFIDENVGQNNELAKDPKFAPIVKLMTNQYRNKFPKASATDINTAVNAYLETLQKTPTKKVTRKTPDNATKLRQGDGGADWEAWMNT